MNVERKAARKEGRKEGKKEGMRMHERMCACICVRACVCMSVCQSVRLSVCLSSCLCVRVSVCAPAPSSAKVVSTGSDTFQSAPPPAPTKDNACKRLAGVRARQRDILKMKRRPYCHCLSRSLTEVLSDNHTR